MPTCSSQRLVSAPWSSAGKMPPAARPLLGCTEHDSHHRELRTQLPLCQFDSGLQITPWLFWVFLLDSSSLLISVAVPKYLKQAIS